MFRTTRLVLVLGLLASATSVSRAGPPSEPLHVQIDRQIASQENFDKLAAGEATDAEFFRRVQLDLAGSIPTATEVREFLSDPAPSQAKRETLIDLLLASPLRARHAVRAGRDVD